MGTEVVPLARAGNVRDVDVSETVGEPPVPRTSIVAVLPLIGAVKARNSSKLPVDWGVNAIPNVQACVALAGQVNGLVMVKFPVADGVMVTASPRIPPILPFETVKFCEELDEPTAWLSKAPPAWCNPKAWVNRRVWREEASERKEVALSRDDQRSREGTNARGAESQTDSARRLRSDRSTVARGAEVAGSSRAG